MRKMYRPNYVVSLFFSLSFLLLFSTCKVGPNYTRPTIESPAKWQLSEEETETLAEKPWWELYQDTVLTNLIDEALFANRDLRIAAARINEAAGIRRIATSNLIPSVSAVGDAEFESDPVDGNDSSPDGIETIQFYGGLRWEVDLWGKLRRGREAAIAEFMASREGHRALAILITSSVARAYFELLDLDYRLEITNNTVDARIEAYRIAELRFKGGLTSELELRQAEVELIQTRTRIPSLEKLIVFKENELNVLLGRNPGAIQRGLQLTSQPIPPTVPAGLPSELLLRRPDIIQAEQQLIAANAFIGVAKGNFYPSLTLTAENGFESLSLRDFNLIPYWDDIINLDLPIYTGGRNKGQLAAAKARYEQSLNFYQQTILISFQEVSNALTDYHKSKENKNLQVRFAATSEQYLRLATLQYMNGLKSYIDVLDAQRRLFEAELAVSEAIRSELLSVVDLYKSLGGGWQTLPKEEETTSEN
ncbi:efflux transporter outer membrane subunit [Sediminitomix flava]|uniref:Multidrug efflux system outer membrane protein n=1 Tax=Sediminitomix flava TaxID=379075 RepID=A0A315Z6K5_SEDFL|nr:efflux transporter outer membrane subunit [Sediminitomix flava]PWJ39161.1 multidrug efflux system outer membrane protein [Sediminitomix flava]